MIRSYSDTNINWARPTLQKVIRDWGPHPLTSKLAAAAHSGSGVGKWVSETTTLSYLLLSFPPSGPHLHLHILFSLLIHKPGLQRGRPQRAASSNKTRLEEKSRGVQKMHRRDGETVLERERKKGVPFVCVRVSMQSYRHYQQQVDLICEIAKHVGTDLCIILNKGLTYCSDPYSPQRCIDKIEGG